MNILLANCKSLSFSIFHKSVGRVPVRRLNVIDSDVSSGNSPIVPGNFALRKLVLQSSERRFFIFPIALGRLPVIPFSARIRLSVAEKQKCVERFEYSQHESNHEFHGRSSPNLRRSDKPMISDGSDPNKSLFVRFRLVTIPFTHSTPNHNGVTHGSVAPAHPVRIRHDVPFVL